MSAKQGLFEPTGASRPTPFPLTFRSPPSESRPLTQFTEVPSLSPWADRIVRECAQPALPHQVESSHWLPIAEMLGHQFLDTQAAAAEASHGHLANTNGEILRADGRDRQPCQLVEWSHAARRKGFHHGAGPLSQWNHLPPVASRAHPLPNNKGISFAVGFPCPLLKAAGEMRRALHV